MGYFEVQLVLVVKSLTHHLTILKLKTPSIRIMQVKHCIGLSSNRYLKSTQKEHK